MAERWQYNFLWVGDGDAPFETSSRTDEITGEQHYSAALISGLLDPDTALEILLRRCDGDVPWLVLAPAAGAEKWFDRGAVGFIPPQTDPFSITATLSGISRLLDLARTKNPLSGLPGNRTITSRLRSDVLMGSSLAAYLDISGFKPFNDYYGFTRGDAVLRSLADILVENLPMYFTGHVGGDDFVCIGTGDEFVAAVTRAVRVFNGRAGGFYNGRDHAEGGIEAQDRSGEFRFYPIMDLTMSLVDGSGCSTVEDLARKAGLEKKRIKGEMLPGTAYALLRNDDIDPDYSDFRKWMDVVLPDRVQVKAMLESAGILGDRRMTGCLIDILRREPDHNIRKSAARALGHVADIESAGALTDALGDRSAHVRTAAATALPMVMGQDAGRILKSCLADSSTWVRRAALRGLGISGWSEAAGILQRQLSRPAEGRYWLNYRQEHAAAIEGIAFLGDERIIGVIISVLHDNPGIRKDVIWRAIIALGGEKCVGEMIESARKGRYREYIQFMDRLDIQGIPPMILGELEKELISLKFRNAAERIYVLKFLQRLPETAPDWVSEWLFGLLNSAATPDEFEALFNAMTARRVLPRGFDMGRIISRAVQNRLSLTRKGMVSMLRWASTGKYALSRTFVEKLLRHDSREIRTAAARTVVQLAGKKGNRKRSSGSIE